MQLGSCCFLHDISTHLQWTTIGLFLQIIFIGRLMVYNVVVGTVSHLSRKVLGRKPTHNLGPFPSTCNRIPKFSVISFLPPESFPLVQYNTTCQISALCFYLFFHKLCLDSKTTQDQGQYLYKIIHHPSLLSLHFRYRRLSACIWQRLGVLWCLDFAHHPQIDVWHWPKSRFRRKIRK